LDKAGFDRVSSLVVRDCDPPKVFHPVGRPAFTNKAAAAFGVQATPFSVDG
jgi:hypothetical protein